jgi:hypothetical protein
MTDATEAAIAVAETDVKPLRRDSFWTWVVTDKKELSQDNLIQAFRNNQHFKTYEEALKAATTAWSLAKNEYAGQAVFVEVQPLRMMSERIVKFEAKVTVEVTEVKE